MKIRSRLTLLFTILVAALLLGFSVVIYWSAENYRRNEFYRQLKEKAETTAHLLIGPEEIDKKFLQEIDARDLTVLHQEEVVIFGQDNRLVYDSGKEPIHVSDRLLDRVRKEGEIKVRAEDREMIGILYNDGRHKHVVIASAIDRYGFSKQANLRAMLAVGWIFSTALVVFLGWIFSSNALRPISAMVAQVESLHFANLGARLQKAEAKDEISSLAATFNRMLDRVERSVETQKSFVSNASHELRTPLTAIAGQIEITLNKDRSEEEYRQILVSIQEDVKSLVELSNGLLDLAKVSGDAAAIRMDDVRIDEALWEAAEDMGKRRPGCRVNIGFTNIDEATELQKRGNLQLLKSAFFNLMENGCKFSEDKQVNVQVSVTGQQIELQFIDNGIGIPAADLEHVFTPYYRSSNAANIQGYGVGLALVRKVIDLHGGTLRVEPGRGKGTAISVLL